jgi:hypothetical protein
LCLNPIPKSSNNKLLKVGTTPKLYATVMYAVRENIKNSLLGCIGVYYTISRINVGVIHPPDLQPLPTVADPSQLKSTGVSTFIVGEQVR